MNLCDALQSVTFPNGQLIIQEGQEPAELMYFVESGLVRIAMLDKNNRENGEVEIKQLGKGEYFGGEDVFAVSVCMRHF